MARLETFTPCLSVPCFCFFYPKDEGISKINYRKNEFCEILELLWQLVDAAYKAYEICHFVGLENEKSLL